MRANDNDRPPGAEAMEEAADWVDRLDELTAADHAALRVWLNASADHARAFGLLRRTLQDPALLRAAEQIQAAAPPASPPLRPAARARWGASPHPGRIAASLAAVIAIAAVVGVGLGLPRRNAEPPLAFATAIGARSDHALSDASMVHLNADSRLSVHFSPDVRDLTLEKGDAMFEVTKNPDRPFKVAAGRATVTAVGTSFEVDRMDDALEVRVFEGVVRVAQAGAPAYLVRKGQWLRLAADRPTTGWFPPESSQTWRSDWLVADQTPLRDVVARLNRYSQDQIIVRERRVGELKVTGRFRLSRTADALAMISALLGVETARTGQHIYVNPRRMGAPSQPPTNPI